MDLRELERIIQERAAASADESYTARLLERGLAVIARKVIEEAGETVGAAIEADGTHLSEEVADLFYHVLVLLHLQGVPLDQVMQVLATRHRKKSPVAPAEAAPGA